jgi:hypothetical protein
VKSRRIRPTGGPGCYRVMLRGDNTLVWGPIVHAADESEAFEKARVLFKGCEPVEARFLHAGGPHDAEKRGEVHDALDAKINQAHFADRRRGGIGLVRRIA